MLSEHELARIWPALMGGMPLQFAIIDRERRIRYVNRIEHGFDRSRILGARVDDFLPAAERDHVVGVIEDVFLTKVPGSYTTTVRTPSGPVLFVVRVGAIDVEDMREYAILISLDVTQADERRHVAERERAMLAALESVNQILISAPITEPTFDRVLEAMLTIFDCERAFLAYPCDPTSPEFTIVYEQTVPGFPGAKGRTLPVDAAVAERFELALRTPESAVRSDPEYNPIPPERWTAQRFSVKSMLYAAVRPEIDRPWFIGIHHCREPRVYEAEVPLLSAIAARVADSLKTWKTQQAMRQSEERFRLLVEHAPEAMVILDVATAKFVEVNRKAVELFGLPLDSLLRVGPVELSPALQPNGLSSAELAPRYIAATLAGESPVFEWLHQDASGKVLECEIRLLHLPHPEHQWVRGSILDIGDRKRAERENERLSAQLAQAQKMQAIGHLTGGVAHDFNNLLTVISGSLALIELDARSGSDVSSHAELALEACRRGAALTQQLLAFSRQQPLRPRSIDVPQLLRGMQGLLARTLGETIHIEVICREDLWSCEVDPAQLESAILNLSINARDAMSDGGRLTIEASNISLDAGALAADEDVMPGAYVLIRVSDDGSGIPEEHLAKVFEPFFTTKEVGKGSGLGLSMVYGFTRQSHGHVKIYSELGHGTTVKLFLPRGQKGADALHAHTTRESAPRGDGELVLIVEDDAGLRSIVVEQLERLGYRTLAAGDARGALDLLKESAGVALLLADMVLPGGVNGAELVRQAEALGHRVPVLFMSGYTENAVIHDGRLDEGVRLLEKPFTTIALATAVRAALNGQ